MISDIKGMFSYRIDRKIFMRADSQTTKGMYKAHGPYFMMDESLDGMNIGLYILKTFEECKIGIPHPEDLTKLSVLEKSDPYSLSEEAKLLKKLKKTHKDLRLGIEFNNGEYHFIPYAVRSRQGSSPLYEKKLISDADPENLGRTLLQAFDLCQ